MTTDYNSLRQKVQKTGQAPFQNPDDHDLLGVESLLEQRYQPVHEKNESITPAASQFKIPPQLYQLARVQRAQMQKYTAEQVKQLQNAFKEIASSLESEPFPKWPFSGHQRRVASFLAHVISEESSSALDSVVESVYNTMLTMAKKHTEEQINYWTYYYGKEALPLNLDFSLSVLKETLIKRKKRSITYWKDTIDSTVRKELLFNHADRNGWLSTAERLQNRFFHHRMKELGLKDTPENRELLSDNHWSLEALEGLKELKGKEKIIDSIYRSTMGLGLDFYQAQRIVVTEGSYAYNAAHLESLRVAKKKGIGVKKTCIVCRDSRMASDSIVMIGQIRELDEMFVDGEGRQFLHPPGRPNDRETEVAYIPLSGLNDLPGVTETQNKK